MSTLTDSIRLYEYQDALQKQLTIWKDLQKQGIQINQQKETIQQQIQEQQFILSVSQKHQNTIYLQYIRTISYFVFYYPCFSCLHCFF